MNTKTRRHKAPEIPLDRSLCLGVSVVRIFPLGLHSFRRVNSLPRHKLIEIHDHAAERGEHRFLVQVGGIGVAHNPGGASRSISKQLELSGMKCAQPVQFGFVRLSGQTNLKCAANPIIGRDD